MKPEPSPTEYPPANSSVIPSPHYFMVADILGFSQLIDNLNEDLQSQRIRDWVDLVRETSSEVGIREIQLFSDTLFVMEDDSEEGLQRLLVFARNLINEGINRSLPIRGAVTHGNVAWGDLTYGKAVLDAHRLEQSSEWIGVVCSPKLPRIDSFWSWDLVVPYPVPMKSGPVVISAAVVWEIPPSKDLIENVTGGGTFNEGEFITWAVLAKFEQTLQFSLYIRLGRRFGFRPDEFVGEFPMHAIELAIGDLIGV